MTLVEKFYAKITFELDGEITVVDAPLQDSYAEAKLDIDLAFKNSTTFVKASIEKEFVVA